MQQRVVLGFALALGVAAVAIINLILDQSATETNVPTVEVLAAARDIQRGEAIDVTMITTKRIPQTYLHQSSVGVDDQESIRGQQVVNQIPEGQVMLWSDLEGLGREAFTLSKAVAPGQRAVSISVDNVTGVAGHVRPDDYVDVLATFVIPREFNIEAGNLKGADARMAAVMDQIAGTDGGTIRKTTLTLLQRVKVLATGGLTGGGASLNASGFPGMSRNTGQQVGNFNATRRSAIAGIAGAQGYQTLTLLVSPIDAEILAFSSDKATLSVALRNPDDLETFTGENRLPKVILPDILDLEKIERARRPAPRAPSRPSGPVIIE